MRFLVLSALCIAGVWSSGTWDYAGHDYWPVSHSDACKGIRQSPIAINNSDVQDLYFWNQLVVRNYQVEIEGTFKNDGHTLKFEPAAAYTPGPSRTKTIPSFEAPVLAGEYELLQYHFHWGATDDRGSEHTIDGKAYPLELHLVHINKKYNGDAAAALAANDGLSVMGIMFQISDETDPALTVILTALDTIIAAGGDKDDSYTWMPTTEDHNLLQFLSKIGRGYYYYKGSLTTPSCNEVVDWLVFENAVQITAADMAKFRMLEYQDEAPMVDNFRPPQPINNRIIKRVFN